MTSSEMLEERSMRTVAVIGAGLSGVVSLKSCVEEGLEPTCFEITDKCGGLWIPKQLSEEASESSTVYDSMITNFCKEMTSFSDYPMPESYPTYLTPTHVYENVEAFMTKFDLYQYCKFHHKVLRVSREDDPHSNTHRWMVTVKNMDTDEELTQAFDAVMLCSGIHGYPSIPELPGADNFSGSVIHSKSYRNSEPYGDRRVIVVGSGPSAIDIAVDVAENTSHTVYLSKRRGCFFLSRNYSAPLDMLFTPFRMQLLNFAPRFVGRLLNWFMRSIFDYDKYEMLPSGHDVLGQQMALNDKIRGYLSVGKIKPVSPIHCFTSQSVQLKTGEKINVDDVIFATGYSVKIPYLDTDVFNQSEWRLYKYVWPVDLDSHTLAVIGHYSAKGAFLPAAELQARWAVQVFKNQAQLPERKLMLRSEEVSQGAAGLSVARRIVIEPVTYSWEVAEHVGCRPSRGVWTLLTRPLLWCKLMFGPSVPYVFRLVGPGRWDGATNALYTTWDRIYAGCQTSNIKD